MHSSVEGALRGTGKVRRPAKIYFGREYGREGKNRPRHDRHDSHFCLSMLPLRWLARKASAVRLTVATMVEPLTPPPMPRTIRPAARLSSLTKLSKKRPRVPLSPARRSLHIVFGVECSSDKSMSADNAKGYTATTASPTQFEWCATHSCPRPARTSRARTARSSLDSHQSLHGFDDRCSSDGRRVVARSLAAREVALAIRA